MNRRQLGIHLIDHSFGADLGPRHLPQQSDISADVVNRVEIRQHEHRHIRLKQLVQRGRIVVFRHNHEIRIDADQPFRIPAQIGVLDAIQSIRDVADRRVLCEIGHAQQTPRSDQIKQNFIRAECHRRDPLRR